VIHKKAKEAQEVALIYVMEAMKSGELKMNQLPRGLVYLEDFRLSS